MSDSDDNDDYNEEEMGSDENFSSSEDEDYEEKPVKRKSKREGKKSKKSKKSKNSDTMSFTQKVMSLTKQKNKTKTMIVSAVCYIITTVLFYFLLKKWGPSFVQSSNLPVQEMTTEMVTNTVSTSKVVLYSLFMGFLGPLIYICYAAYTM